MADIVPAQLPFAEAIDFFKSKVDLPTAAYGDLVDQQHSLAFSVAGAQSDALLADFRGALTQAMQEGTGYAQFRKDFEAIVNKHKWAYNGKPGWRSRVIYDTNVTQAYHAGRWQQMWRLRHVRPFLRYVHTSVDHPRREHQAWDGTILPMTHGFWDSHTPQNGWGCKCQLQSLTAEEAEAAGGATPAPEVEWQEVVVNPKGSQPRVVRTPKGVQAGFGYNPGKAYLQPHTVPPLAGYDTVVQQRMAAGQMVPGPLKPRSVAQVMDRLVPDAQASAVLPADTSPESAVQQFLGVFGLEDLDQAQIIQDVTGTRLAISQHLFLRNGSLDWMPEPMRRSALLQAHAVLEPDEVWWAWEQAEAGDWVLRRHYVKAFADDDGVSVASFAWARDGWIGRQALQVDKSTAQDALMDYRVGRLVYQWQD